MAGPRAGKGQARGSARAVLHWKMQAREDTATLVLKENGQHGGWAREERPWKWGSPSKGRSFG